MANETMVTIPLEEHMDLRRRAEENLYLATQLGGFEQKLFNIEDRLWKLERRIEDGK